MRFSKKKLVGLSSLAVVLIVSVFFIATSATVSHKPSEIVPQGPGSGLDADTVDGLHAADLLAQSGVGDQRKITIWGSSSCPSGYNTILSGGLLTRFSAISTFGGVPLVPSVNLFVCAGSAVSATAIASTNGTVSGPAGWDRVPKAPDAFGPFDGGVTSDVLSCVICERNSTF